MKRFITLLFLIGFFSLNGFADPISAEAAKEIGRSFLSNPVSAVGLLKINKQQTRLELIYSAEAMPFGSNNRLSQKAAQMTVPFYVFSTENQGFVIVAGDDCIIPILGYANEGAFDPDNIPPTMQKWLEGYKAEIRYAIENHIVASPEVQAEWQALQSGVGSMKSQTMASSVAPLITTKWDQAPYYNDLCPYDYQERTVSGCVATAMAQVMKFWNFPATGFGFHSYNHSTYGTLSANFGSTTYNWADMPDQLTSSSTSTQKNAVATLMYHCGVAVEMNYNIAANGGSGAMTICSGYNNCTASAEDALKTFFGYKTTLQGIHKRDYTSSNWINLLKTELDAGRPIVYAGRGNEGGHCFVCDGYENNNYFHFNWGWSGQNDGYFALTALNPGSGGAGGGSYTFTDEQRAIIGIEPENNATTTHQYDLRLYSNPYMSDSKIWFTDPFSLTVDIANYGTGSFSGQFGAAVFNSNFDFLDFIEIKTNISMNPNTHFTNGLTFNNAGSAAFVPGTYYVAVFYKTETQDWTIVANGNYTNFQQFEIYYSTDIEANSAFTISTDGGKLIQGQSATVNMDVLNSGNSTFYGNYRVNLANLDGSWAQDIQILNETTGLPYNYHYIGGNNFTGIITVEPGTYLLELGYQAQGSSIWYYAGSSNYSNPVYVIVEAPAINPDMYENNDTQPQAYNLSVSFSENSATKNTNSANFHIGTDIDYYKIVLPSGYNYTITPRLHDEYNSGNGQTYTVDALYAYSINGTEYSETYDDVMPGNIALNNGGTLFFKIAPYYQGSSGTYLMDFAITRIVTSGIEDIKTNAQISLYPNPANDFVTIDLHEFTNRIHQIALCDVLGRQIYMERVAGFEKTITIPLTDASNGVYWVQIYSEKGIITRKLMVKK